jgi:hypothetical protein
VIPLRIIRRRPETRPTPPPAPEPAPAAPQPAACERCRGFDETTRLAQERFVEIRQLQRQNQELQSRLRALESGTAAPASQPGQPLPVTAQRLRRMLGGPSIVELPVDTPR